MTQPLDYWDDPTIVDDVKATLTAAEKIRWVVYGAVFGLLFGVASAPTIVAVLNRVFS